MHTQVMVDNLRINPDSITITTCDADTYFHPNHFAYCEFSSLSMIAITPSDADTHSYQPLRVLLILIASNQMAEYMCPKSIVRA